MTDEELEDKFGKDGWKQLPDEVYRRYSFTPAKIEVEEHHVKVYAGKKTEDVIKAPHPQALLRGALFPFAGGSGNERQICQCRPALPAGTGV